MTRRWVAAAFLFAGILVAGDVRVAAADGTPHQGGKIMIDWSWSANDFWNVDQKVTIEEKAHRRFWAQQINWSSTNVFAYVGLQTRGNRLDGSIGDTAIFSAWNANAARGDCKRFNEAGSGFSCRIAYPITNGTSYRLRLWRQEVDSAGQWWGAWVKNEKTGAERSIGGIRLPNTYRAIGAVRNFVDYFGAAVDCSSVGRSSVIFSSPIANQRLAGKPRKSVKENCISGSVTTPSEYNVQLIHGGRDALATPLVLVHGFERGGRNNCEKTWSDLIRSLRDLHWSNTIVVSQYYSRDTACEGFDKVENVQIGTHGKNDTVHTGHSTDTRIRHLASDWAWMVYDRYTRRLQPIKAVGHSMGGLIIRSAIKEVHAGNSDFPPRLLVEDVVTLGTPHAGAGRARMCATTHGQCGDLSPNSGFLKDLRLNGQNPQGDGGTEWTVIGAADDDTVTSGSATDMLAAETVRYASRQGIEHDQYMHKKLGDHVMQISASASIWHFGKRCATFHRHWPIGVTHLALARPVDDDC